MEILARELAEIVWEDAEFGTVTITSKGKLAELIFQSTTLRLSLLLLLLLLLLALKAVLSLTSTIDAALTSNSNTSDSLILLLKLFIFHHSVVVIISLLWEYRLNLLGMNLGNFLIIPSENLSAAISKLSCRSRWHRKRELLHLYLLLRVLWLCMGLREFTGLLRLTLWLLSLQFLLRYRLRYGLQLLLHLHWLLLLHLLFH